MDCIKISNKNNKGSYINLDHSKENDEVKIREGQEDSAISDTDLIKNKSYPKKKKKDKQFDNQEEFITPPVTHPDDKQ